MEVCYFCGILFITEVNIMKKYVCEVCGWVYDEEEGAPDMDSEE